MSERRTWVDHIVGPAFDWVDPLAVDEGLGADEGRILEAKLRDG